jgi:DNA 3'-phosphatase
MTENKLSQGWMEFQGGLLVRFPNLKREEPEFKFYGKVAGFNLDNTLIKTEPKLGSDKIEFELMYQNVITRLADLHTQEYSIVIISDQTLISKGIISVEHLQLKMDYLCKILADKNIPILGIFTTKNNCLRKPHTWTWKVLANLYLSQNLSINLKESFYIGHLAGRIAKQNLRRDADYVDRAYAHNIGIEFKVPEQLFRQSMELREYNYRDALSDQEKDGFIKMENEKYVNSELYKYKSLYQFCIDKIKQIHTPSIPFMIIMIGPPSSGKTKLANNIAYSASSMIEDKITGKKTLKSPVVIIPETYYVDGKKLSYNEREKIINNFIYDGRILLIDGNYATHKSRYPYLRKAEEYNIPVIFIKLNPPYKICKHFNHIRLEKTQDKFREPLQPFHFMKYNKNYEKPDLNKYKELYPGLKAIIVDFPTIVIDDKAFRYIY